VIFAPDCCCVVDVVVPGALEGTGCTCALKAAASDRSWGAINPTTQHVSSVTARTTRDVVMISQYFISIRSFNVEFPDPDSASYPA
jgi:hypothetical protein